MAQVFLLVPNSPSLQDEKVLSLIPPVASASRKPILINHVQNIAVILLF